MQRATRQMRKRFPAILRNLYFGKCLKRRTFKRRSGRLSRQSTSVRPPILIRHVRIEAYCGDVWVYPISYPSVNPFFCGESGTILIASPFSGRVTDLQPDDSEENPFYYMFQVECTSCRVVHPNLVGISRFVRSKYCF